MSSDTVVPRGESSWVAHGEEDGPDRPGARTLAPDVARLVERAEAIYAGRRLRTAAFGDDADLFGEPSWDLMLDLYIAHERGMEINIGRSVAASAVPTTTGLRYIALLTDRGLLCRIADPLDRRRHFVTLSDRGLAIMRQLLTTI